MLYQTVSEGTYVFLYDSKKALVSFADEWYETVEDAAEVWSPRLSGDGWVVIDDPLPDCQHDGILPIRVRGRDIGKPQWGEYELLQNGNWIEYHK